MVKDKFLAVLVAIMFAVSLGTFGAVLLRPAYEPPSHAGADHKPDKEECWRWWPSPEGWTAIFTGLLTASTALLWGVTRTAANAAKAAGEALPKMERAYVFFTGATGENIQAPNDIINFIMEADTEKKMSFKIVYGFKNHGRTPAIINTVNVRAGYIEKGFPEKIIGDALPMPLVVSGGESPPEGEYGCPLSGIERRKAKDGNGRIFFWAKIVYLDVFETSHETGICAHWNFSESRFVISENKDLNYYT